MYSNLVIIDIKNTSPKLKIPSNNSLLDLFLFISKSIILSPNFNPKYPFITLSIVSFSLSVNFLPHISIIMFSSTGI